jgi:hypothetical protein
MDYVIAPGPMVGVKPVRRLMSRENTTMHDIQSILRYAALVLLAVLANPLASGLESQSWYRGNTHSHTTNSDGDSPPDSVARWYRDAGYSFLFITDHETLTDPVPLNERYGAVGKFLLIPGQEVTQRILDSTRSVTTLQPHLNALGASKVVMPLGPNGRASGVSLAAAYSRNISQIRSAGGIAQVNHPNYRWSADIHDLAGIPDSTLLEIANAHPSVNNAGGYDQSGRQRVSTEALWDSLLTRGKRIWAVASDDSHFFKLETSDWHTLPRPGRAWIMVRADSLSAAHILDAMHRGNFYSSTGVTLRTLQHANGALLLEMDPGRDDMSFTTEFIGAGGRILAVVHGAIATYGVRGGERYVRARVTDSNGRKAWTQAFFLH